MTDRKPTPANPVKRRRPKGGHVAGARDSELATPPDPTDPETLEWAVDLETRLTSLIQDPTTPPRDVASLAKQLMDLKKLVPAGPITAGSVMDELEKKRQARGTA